MARESEWKAIPEVPQDLRPLFDVWFNPDLRDLPNATEINMAELIHNILQSHIIQIYKSEFPDKVKVVPHPAGGSVSIVDGETVLEFLNVIRIARDLIYPQFLLGSKTFPEGDFFSFSWIRSLKEEASTSVSGFRPYPRAELEDRVTLGLACVVRAFKSGVFPTEASRIAFERHIDENNGLFVPKGNKTPEAIMVASLLDQGLYKIAREIVGKTL